MNTSDTLLKDVAVWKDWVNSIPTHLIQELVIRSFMPGTKIDWGRAVHDFHKGRLISCLLKKGDLAVIYHPGFIPSMPSRPEILFSTLHCTNCGNSVDVSNFLVPCPLQDGCIQCKEVNFSVPHLREVNKKNLFFHYFLTFKRSIQNEIISRLRSCEILEVQSDAPCARIN